MSPQTLWIFVLLTHCHQTTMSTFYGRLSNIKQGQGDLREIESWNHKNNKFKTPFTPKQALKNESHSRLVWDAEVVLTPLVARVLIVSY